MAWCITREAIHKKNGNVLIDCKYYCQLPGAEKRHHSSTPDGSWLCWDRTLKCTFGGEADVSTAGETFYVTFYGDSW